MSIKAVEIRDSRTGSVRSRWQVDVHVRDAMGERHRIRRLARSKREARRLERELSAGSGPRAKTTNQEVQNPHHKEEALPAGAVPTLGEFVPRFLAYQRVEGNSPSELSTKESILRVHLLPAFGGLRLDQITTEAVDAYRVRKVASGLARKTVGNHMAVLRRVFTVAKRWHLVGEAPYMPLPSKRELLGRPADFLTFEESEAFLAMVRRLYPRDYLLCWLALCSGLRLGELRALRWQEVRFAESAVLVSRSVTDAAYREDLAAGVREDVGVRVPKWGKIRTVSLPRDLVEALSQARESSSSALVFPGRGRQAGGYRSRSSVEKMVTRAAARGGLGKHVHVHMLRHTYASHLVMRGVDLRTVQELLGHASLEMTMRYAHLATDHKREAVQVLTRRSAIHAGCANSAVASEWRASGEQVASKK